MSGSSVISETDKRRLTEHLAERLRTRLSGRDQADLIDTTPVRTLFAGVLQPVRVGQSIQLNDKPFGTAIGLDFRVAPDSTEPIHITIAAGWSHYYSVFPSWADACSANAQRTFMNLPTASAAGNVQEDSPLGVRAAQMDETPTMDQEEDGDSDDEPPAVPSGSAILPRVWRRKNVAVRPFEVTLQMGGGGEDVVGAPEITEALGMAITDMANDAERWRHLGDPDKRERTLGPALILRNESVYRSALRSVAGEPAPLPKWAVTIHVDSQGESDGRAIRVRILLANATSAFDDSVKDTGLQERALFDAHLKVTIRGGALVPFDFLLAPKDYKSNPKMPAKGINCVAILTPDAPTTVATETLPLFEQPLYRTRDVLSVPFTALVADDALPTLQRVADAMDEYLARWDGFLGEGAASAFSQSGVDACRRERDAFQSEIERYRLGVSALQDNAALLEAFRLMNRGFVRLAERSRGRISSWRLFQIGFIVSQMPSLAVRELSRSRSDTFAATLRDMLRDVAILWFPTGGGKTEAYLGLIAVALLFDRLRGKTRGLTAWMRFPLRMLSLQQLERLGRVIAVLNELRAEHATIQTGDPFAMGYFVGDGNTPNYVSENEMRELEQKPARREDMKLLRKCPHCGSAVSIEARRADWRIAHTCTNMACFSNVSPSLGTQRGSLPIYIVDNEIYRYLPAVLVGTVDKLAIIGRSRHFAHLVRGAVQRCPQHGYTSYDECIEKFSGCSVKKRDLSRLSEIADPGPSLLIQDELHLLRAELGVFNGHYEGLLNYLGSEIYLPPKVLAATATIEAYDTHAFHLYLSRSQRFPQPAWRAGESFYATSEPPEFRRFYVGVLGHTRGIEEPALRALAIYGEEVRQMKIAPRRALEVMGRLDLTDADAADVLRLYDLELCYVNRKATGGSVIDKLNSLERNFLRDGLGQITSKLLTGDQSMDEVGATLDRIDKERSDTGEMRLDIVVATNLISHGVDLERINMMTLCGMPSHYAEYVQATSRCARSHPGLVTVCFRATDPREISQFEFFPVMHQHMDRLIEAVAVNRFASFAPRKTVPGILAGLLLCKFTPELYGTAISRPLDHVPTLNVALGNKPGTKTGTQSGCIRLDNLRSAIQRIIGVDTVRPPASPSQVENIRGRVNDVLDDLIGAIARSLESQLKDVLKPLTSFRDVDEGIDFGSVDSADYAIRLRSR